MTSSERIPNRLINETSPYLLQHAYNPVDWRPWGEEAFETARREDKPVFLSIGYSTCHWCHVMAHESFEDPDVAAILNQYFIPVKVDKEERPDIDSVYMTVCQALTGSGGWPTTIMMAPDGKPFFAGTYFPKRKRYGMPGLIDLLESIRSKWQTNREELTQYANRIIQHINASEKRNHRYHGKPQPLIDQAKDSFKATFDRDFGGFGPQPKFPMPHNLLFLLEAYRLTDDSKCLEMAEKTLLSMAKGGIFDHIGYGFSRYSTDEKWLVPHFEKMLYDNALLLLAYTKAYDVTGVAAYRSVAEKIITYITREMTHSQGAFFSAQDADSDGVEGKYYVFTPGEPLSLLGEEQGGRFNRLYDITNIGNFDGKSIPNQIALPALDDSLADVLPTLYAYRKSRASLHLDDKILTSWNALMIAALCEAATVFQADQYLDMALRALRFIEQNLFEEGEPLVSFRDGRRSGPGMIDEYAFLIYARLTLYQSTLDSGHLESARALMKKAVDKFFDPEEGGFYLYSVDAEKLITRPKETHDGAIPSGNSVMAMNLVLLFHLTGDSSYQPLLEKHFAFMLGEAYDAPAAHAFFLLAVLKNDMPGKKITVVIRDENEKPAIQNALRGQALVTLLDHETPAYRFKDAQTTYYVCDGFVCHPPVTNLQDALS